jgi:hypothetical protein
MAGVKHIEVEATPEESVKAAFDNNLRKENTLRQYVAQTLRLHAHFFQGSEELKDLRWVKTDCTELIDFLKSEYFHKLPAQHGYMFTLMIIAKDHLRDMALWKVYFDRHEEIKKARDAVRPPLQQMTEHEGANWKTLEEITKRREELQRRVNRLILPKQPADLTMEDRIDLIRYLILCLYAYLPTLRNDYSDAPIIFMKDHRSSAIRKLMQGNHITETAKGQYTFHLRYFKTDRTHAEKAYTFPTRMNNVVTESLTVFPSLEVLVELHEETRDSNGLELLLEVHGGHLAGCKRRFELDEKDPDLERVQGCTIPKRSGRKNFILLAFCGRSADPLRDKVQAQRDSHCLAVTKAEDTT